MIVESFPTIDLCVNFLISIGCEWTSEKEQILETKSVFKFDDYYVFHDPQGILDIHDWI